MAIRLALSTDQLLGVSQVANLVGSVSEFSTLTRAEGTRRNNGGGESNSVWPYSLTAWPRSLRYTSELMLSAWNPAPSSEVIGRL